MFGFGEKADNILQLLCSGEEVNIQLAESIAQGLKIPLKKLIAAAGFHRYGVRKPAEFLQRAEIEIIQEQLNPADMQLISRFKPLKKLKIYHSEVASLESLELLPNLEECYIHGSKIGAWGKLPLAKMEQVLSRNLDTDPAELARWLGLLPNLRWLSAIDCKLDTMDFCQHLPNLWSLDLSFNKLQNFDTLRYLTSLLMLSLDGTGLKTLDISQNTNLQELKAQNNELNSLNLTQNYRLTKLNLANNRLEQLNLSQNKSLESVVLGFNNLKSFELRDKPALDGLNLISNKLETLHLRSLPRLVWLSLDYNPLLSELVLEGLPRLSKISISKDMIHSPCYPKLQQKYGQQLVIS